MSACDAQFAGWMEAGLARPIRAEAMPRSAEIVASLVEEYSAALYRVAYSVTRNAAEAEDAVQETFLRVLRHEDQLSELRNPRVWLVRITWNIVLDRKRRAKTRPETDDLTEIARLLPSGGVSADERVIAIEQHARVLALIDQLPGKEREVLLLSAFEELSTAHIAEVLGTTESSVRSRLFRARRLLTGMLARERSTR